MSKYYPDIRGRVFKGNGLGKKLGFPTINVSLESWPLSRVEPNIYNVTNHFYGDGVAIVLAKYAQIHFHQDCDFNKSYIQVSVVSPLFDVDQHPSVTRPTPHEGTLLKIIYDGLVRERERYKIMKSY